MKRHIACFLVFLVWLAPGATAGEPLSARASQAARAKGDRPLVARSRDVFQPEVAAGEASGFFAPSFFTGFEASEGFVPGFVLGQPESADETLNWAISDSSRSEVEGSIRTTNPQTGTQHLELGYDPAIYFPENFAPFVDARIPADDVAETVGATLVPRPFTFTADVFVEESAGTALRLFLQSQAAGLISTGLRWDGDGSVYLLAKLDEPGSIEWVPIGGWQPSTYQSLKIVGDPCTGTMRYFLDDTLLFCAYPLDANADGFSDECGSPWAPAESMISPAVDQLVFWNDSPSPAERVSIDNVSMERSTADCPPSCQLDTVSPPCFDDASCPQGWVCVDRCRCELCVGVPVLPEGESIWPAGEGSGWYTFTATADAYAIDTCRTTGDGESVDTVLFGLSGTCESYEIAAMNDDCVSAPGRGDGADPASRCFDDLGGASYPNQGASCFCMPTIPGEDYLVVDVGPTLLENDLVLNLQPVASCVELGACCDRRSATCVEEATFPTCLAPSEWVEGATCEEIDCVFLAIPTVSTWGLLALALSLLILAKIGSNRAIHTD